MHTIKNSSPFVLATSNIIGDLIPSSLKFLLCFQSFRLLKSSKRTGWLFSFAVIHVIGFFPSSNHWFSTQVRSVSWQWFVLLTTTAQAILALIEFFEYSQNPENTHLLSLLLTILIFIQFLVLVKDFKSSSSVNNFFYQDIISF